MTNLPVLTFRQPWAWAVSHCPADGPDGPKRVENRSWRLRYTGPVWLHAGARSRWDPDGQHSKLVRRAWAEYARLEPEAQQSMLRRDTAWMTFGAVVALITVTGCHHARDCWPGGYCSPWAASGAWHIKIGEVRQLPEPLEHCGWPGIWYLAPSLEAAALAQLAQEGT